MSHQQDNEISNAPAANKDIVAILESIDELIYITDPETYEIAYTNKKFNDTYGIIHSCTGEKCYKVIHHKDEPCEFCNNKALSNSKDDKGLSGEFQNAITNRWYRFKDKIVKWSDGRLLKMETATDITDEKTLTSELKANNERYALVTAASDSGIWDWWLDSEDTYYSKQWKALLGYEDHELENKFETWSKLLHPEDKERMHKSVQDFIAQPQAIFVEEFRMKHKDGSYRWINNRAASVLDDKGKVIRMFGTHKDITEEKKLHQELRKTDRMYRGLIENAPDGIMMLNKNNECIFFSTSALEMFGYPPKAALNMKLEDIAHPKEITKISKIIKDVYQQKDHAKEILECRFLNNEKTWHWFESTFSLSIDEQGQAALVINFRDIEERRKQERALLKAKKNAEKASIYKDQFLTNMSHDIRTPINGIIGFSDLLNDDISLDKRKRYVNIIKSSSNQLLNLINDIIDTSKMEIGELKLHYHSCNIPQLLDHLRSTFDLIKEQKDRDDIAIQCIVPDHYQHLTMNTDAARLQQVLSNLISNAMKFTKHYIEFGFDVKENTIRFYVKDDGIGIPKDKIDQIFKRFEQVREEDETKHHGTGLGLSISKGIIELMNGTIAVTSEENKGSTFTFTLPYEAGEALTAPSTHDVNTKENVKPAKTKILIAEDQHINIEYFKVILKDYPCQLSIAKNGQEAVKLYSSQPDFDIVLMDIRMPVMDGMQATRQILNINPRAKIIAQTAFAMAQDEQHFLEEGCIDYLSKPITKEALVKMINKWRE